MTSRMEEGEAGAHLPKAPDLRVVYRSLLASQDKQDAAASHLVIAPEQLTTSWVAATGLQAPTLIRADQRYRDKLQDVLQPSHGSFDLDKLPQLLEPPDNGKKQNSSKWRMRVEDREVLTVDISHQAPGPRWSVRQWCLYWRDRRVEPFTGNAGGYATGNAALEGDSTQLAGGGQSRMQQRQQSDVVAHLSAGGTDDKAEAGAGDEEDEADSAFVHQGAVDQFETHSAPRKGIRDSNKKRLISLACLCIADTPLGPHLAPPAALMATDLLKALDQPAVALQFPYRHFLACHPAGAVLNFTINPTGATAWCHVLAGRMLVVLVPPSTHNLSVYATWAHKGPRAAGLLLTDACQGVVRLQVEEGESVIIPGGWPYCLAALEDSLLLGSQVLHLNNMRLQFTSWEVEELLSVKPRMRFPSFKHITWHTALHYAKALRVAAGLPKGHKLRITSSKDAGAAPTPTVSHSQAVARRHARWLCEPTAPVGGPPKALTTATTP